MPHKGLSMNKIASPESSNDIAIIAMACRFPGAQNPQEFWQNLRDGRESITFFTDQELDPGEKDSHRQLHPRYVKAAAILEDIALFDAAFFGFTPREADITDPQQRLFLECAWEAFEIAGYDPTTSPGAIGVYAGAGGNAYFLTNLYPNRQLFATLGSYNLSLANRLDFLSTRVAYKLNLKGPSLTLQTACSTSLVAVHFACQSLLNGECDMTLAGGVSISVPQKTGYLYQEGGILSPDGHCRAFDARAQGTVAGSGVGVVLLKRLADALADGDSVLAVIKGSAINNDGALKAGFTAPSVDGQAAVIAEALAVAGVHPETVTYIEAHGTGTALGDPIEIKALTQAFQTQTHRQGFCAIGSVKTNIGHLDTAAGIAGLLKTVLALQHKLLPPSLHFERPNPQIDFTHSPFYVNTRLATWPAEQLPRRAGVSSLGIGGTNAHVILEEAPSLVASDPSRPWHLLVFSAQTGSALEVVTTQMAAYLQQHPVISLADVAYTLQVGRKAFRHRRMVLCQTCEEAVIALERQEPKRLLSGIQETTERPVVFMFPGQGTQYVNMGLDLYQTESVFRDQIEHCATLLTPHLGLDLRQVLYPTDAQAASAAQQLRQTAITQPALFVLEYALAQLWLAWGIQPQALVGHSLGEYVAACLADVMSLEDALALVAARGRLMQQVPEGAMLAVALAEATLQPLLGTTLALAAHNGPTACVVAGPAGEVEALELRLRQQGVGCRQVPSAQAFHSAMLEPIIAAFTACVAPVALRPPQIPYVSNVTGTWITAAEATEPQYWARHLRHTVRFAEGLHTLGQDSSRILLEVGPGQTLSSFARRHPDITAEQVVLASLPQAQGSESAGVLHALGRLWLAGMPVQWSRLYAGERRHRLPLPTYPFERKSHWVAPPRPLGKTVAAETREPATLPVYDTHETPSGGPATAGRPPQHSREERGEHMAALQVGLTPHPARREHLLATLQAVAHEVSGIDPAAIDPSATFLDMGVNSLLLIQFSQAIQDRVGVEIPFRLLCEELSSLDALSAYLDRQLPAEALPAETPPVPTRTIPASSTERAVVTPLGTQRNGVWNGAEQSALSGPALERILAQQLQVMSQQIDMLRGAPLVGKAGLVEMPAAADSLPEAPALPALPQVQWRNPTDVPSGLTPAEPGRRNPERLGPFRPITRGTTDALNTRQQDHLNALIARYSGRMRESKRLTQAYRPSLADTRAIVGFRLPWKELVCPIIAPRALGSRVWDVDGNEYIDLTMGFGVNLFGHSPAFITAALQEQLGQGIHLGPQSPLTGQVAQLLCELTGMARVTFCNTGSEAVMTALRLARTATRRTKFAVFAGSYHGNFDEVLFRAQTVEGQLQAVPVAPGIPAHLLKDVLVLEYARPESLATLKAHAHELAAVLVEPVQSGRLALQPRAFLHELRNLTAEAGIALIFDEMISGFRIHPGGAQAWFGVEADLATYGKVIGGGMPLGVVAGKAAYLDAIDGGMWNYGDASYPPATLTFFAGTFCKHPLAMAAALAALQHLKSQGPALQQQLNERTEQLVTTLQEHFVQARLPIRLEHFGSMFRFVFERGVQCPDLFYFHLLEKGIHLWEGRACFLSTAHTAADVAEVIRIVQESAEAMQEGGFFPGSAPSGSATAPAATQAQTMESPPAARTAPLTDGQKDVWMLSQLGDDASRASNLPTALRLRGPCNMIALQQALQTLEHRHEALRTTFSADGEQQWFWSTMAIACPVVDLTGITDDAREVQVARGIRREAQQVFDLRQGPLLRMRLVKVGEDDHLLTLTMHHIIIDGRSFGLLMKELKTLYAAACQGIAPQLPSCRGFQEYAVRQAQQRHTPEALAAEAYWLGQFDGHVPLLTLPTDRPRPPVQTYAGARQEMQIAASLQQACRDLSAQHGCTLFTTLLAAWQALLHRLTGQHDLVVGIAAVEPSAMSGRNLLGYTTNLLPLRSRVQATLTFAEHLNNVKQMVFDAYQHQSYSLLRLSDKLQVPQAPGSAPLIAALFNMDYAGAGLAWHDLQVEMSSHPSGAVECDIFWNLTDAETGICVECYYNTDLFEGQTMQRWLRSYQAMLVGVVSHPSQPLWQIPLSTEVAPQQLLSEWQ